MVEYYPLVWRSTEVSKDKHQSNKVITQVLGGHGQIQSPTSQ